MRNAEADTITEYTEATYGFQERKEFVEEILMALRSGDFKIRNRPNESTFRCPFCPSRKKQLFMYNDLLQHSQAVAEGRTRGTSEQGKHCALATYLRTDLAHLAAPRPSRAHKLDLKTTPQREDLEARDLLLCPWSVVVHNLQKTVDERTKLGLGPSSQEVKSCFSSFQPKKVDVIWGPKGHTGTAVITFVGDFEGWKNAQAFERWFIEREHGRRDWEKRHNRFLLADTDPYGWLARKEDYYGRNECNEDHLVAKFLQARGPLELKDIGMVGDDLKSMHEQRFQHLAEELKEKKSDFFHLVEEVERAKRNAQDMIARLEEKHKQELDEMNAKAQLSTQGHIVQMRAHNMVLESSMKKLLSRLQELSDKEKLPQTQGEMIQLEQAKKENRLKLDIVNQQAEFQKKHQANQMALITKHEVENEHLAEWIQFKKMHLAKKHLMELEHQRLDEMRETRKLVQLAHSVEDPEYLLDKGMIDLEDQIRLMEKQKADLLEELEDLKVDNDSNNETIMALTRKERIANDELQGARRAAETAIEEHGTPNTFYLRKMGEIDDGPWREACRERYSLQQEDWQLYFRKKYSRWEEMIRHPDFSPFNVISVGGTRVRYIDYSNNELRKLHENLGEEVVKTVIQAVDEIEEYNPCCRYPISKVWNAQENKLATLEQVIQHMHILLKQAISKQKKRSRLGLQIN